MSLENSLRWLLSDRQELLVKAEEEDLGFGFDPRERPPELYIKYGVINLDKPPGPTSHQVTTWVKEILGVSKAGHGGTLDPMVTGVLPIGLEKATAAMRYVVGSSKEYVGIMRLHGDVDRGKLDEVFRMFRGRVYQRPPYRSSVKRKLRTREIYDLKILEVEGRDVLFWISCESGFYVRKLAHDIGLVLGVEAHLSELRRVRAGPFTEDTITDLYTLKAAAHKWAEEDDFTYLRRVIQPMEVVFRNYPKIFVKDTAVAAIAYGASLKAPGVLCVTSDVKRDSVVALMSKKGELIATAVSKYDAQDIVELDRGEVATIQRVFMERDLYPPMWRKKSA